MLIIPWRCRIDQYGEIYMGSSKYQIIGMPKYRKIDMLIIPRTCRIDQYG